MDSGLQPLQRGAELCAERDARGIGYRPSLHVGRPTRRLVGAREDVVHHLDFRLLGQGCYLAFEGGEAPYDIFVRWKPLHLQPIGWDPDLNDGVRMNIRPFVEAGVLRLPRNKLGIKWEPDRGKDVPSAPWYKLGPIYGEPEGTRINDHHLTLAEKQAARAKVAAGRKA